MSLVAASAALCLCSAAPSMGSAEIRVFLPAGSGASEKRVASLISKRSFEQALREIDLRSANGAARGRNLILKAQVDLALDETDAAARDMTAAWKTGTLDNATLFWAIDILHHISDDDACGEMCNKIMQSKDRSQASYGHFVKARIEANRGNSVESLKNYESAMMLNPSDPRSFVESGGYYLSSGKYKQAIDVSSKALSLLKNESRHKGTIGALHVRAKAYARLRRYKEALADYDRAIAFGPLIRELFVERSEVYRALGFLEKAAADLRHVKSLDNGY